MFYRYNKSEKKGVYKYIINRRLIGTAPRPQAVCTVKFKSQGEWKKERAYVQKVRKGWGGRVSRKEKGDYLQGEGVYIHRVFL